MIDILSHTLSRIDERSLAGVGLSQFSAGHNEPTGPFLTSWPGEPALAAAMLVGLALYVIGWRRLRRGPAARVLPRWRIWCYLAGLLALALAVLSPIAVFSERLFFMHMVQHLLLLLIAPPLLWLGMPLIPVIWGLPAGIRRPIGRWMCSAHGLGHLLTSPMVAVAVYTATIALWHVPRLYDAAQGASLTHDLQHVMFLGTALLYWWPVIHPSGGRRRLSYGLAIPYLLPPFLEGMLIGVLLTFTDRLVYTTYEDMEPTWGMQALDDQQLGGLIMWVPGGMLFLIPLIGLIAMLLREEQPSPRRTGVHSPARRAS